MQTDSTDDSLVREAIALLGPGAKDASLDDLTAWLRQLEELCGSQAPAVATASFRTDMSGSCRSTFPECGKKPTTTAQTTKLQAKDVKGYPSLPELHLEKVSSNKKTARGEAKLRLSVDRGPVLVMLTITDFDGATHTLHAVTADENDLIPIKHPGTRIEATVIPFAPDELLERLRHVEVKIRAQRIQPVQPSASTEQKASVDEQKASAPRQADGVKCMTRRVDGRVFEYIFDSEKGTVTMKSSQCCNPCCGEANKKEAPATYTLKVNTREIEIINCERVKNVVAPILKSFQENPRRQLDLCKRVASIFKEERSIHEKLATAKPGEKKRLWKELDWKNAEYQKLKDLMFRTAETGGWLGVSEEELYAVVEKAMQKAMDPERVVALDRRVVRAFYEYTKIIEKLESTSSQTNKKRLLAALVRKEIEFDEAMNDIAVIADGRVDEDGSEEEDSKEQKDVSIRIACRVLAAFDEHNTVKEELESVTSGTLMKRLSKLLGHKETDFDEATNSVAVMAGRSEQEESQELDDVFTRMIEA